MSLPVDEFVEQAQGIVDAEDNHEGQYIHTYHGQLDGEEDTVRILTLAPDIDDTTVFEAFTQVTGEWQNASTHPNVVSVYDRGDAPQPWVAVENIDGQPLDAAQPNLSPGEIETVIDNVAEAVRNVALYNATHGALSPDQIWIVPDDDGVSAVVDDWGLRQAVSRVAGSIDVTPYTAPELLADPDSVTQQTDVYGLGAVAYYTLTGSPPVSGSDLETIIQEGDIAPPSNHDDTLSQTVDDVLLQALATDPDERYESAYTFKLAFRQAFTPETQDNEEDSTAAAAGATTSDTNEADNQAEADDGSLVSRRATLGMLGIGVVGIGSGWMATQMGGNNDNESAPVTTPTETPTESETPFDTSTAQATETETPTDGESSSGSVITDGFEDGNTSGWISSPPRTSSFEASQERVFSGSWAAELSGGSKDNTTKWINSGGEASPTTVETAHALENGELYADTYTKWRLGDTTVLKVNHNWSNGFLAVNGTGATVSSNSDTGAVVSDLPWPSSDGFFHVVLDDIDWQNNVVGEVRVNGTEQAQDVEFMNKAGSIDRTVVFIGGHDGNVMFIDDTTVSSE